VSHGDSVGAETLRRSLVDWLTDLELISAGGMAEADGYIGYMKPYDTSHQEYNEDKAFQEDVLWQITGLDVHNKQIRAMTGEGARSFDVLYPALGCDVKSDLAVALGAATGGAGCLKVDEHQCTTVKAFMPPATWSRISIRLRSPLVMRPSPPLISTNSYRHIPRIRTVAHRAGHRESRALKISKVTTRPQPIQLAKTMTQSRLMTP
jgi:hypothetical protein